MEHVCVDDMIVASKSVGLIVMYSLSNSNVSLFVSIKELIFHTVLQFFFFKKKITIKSREYKEIQLDFIL